MIFVLFIKPKAFNYYTDATFKLATLFANNLCCCCLLFANCCIFQSSRSWL